MLEAIAASRGRFKGIALVKPDITDRDLAKLGGQGVVGVRVNLLNHGLTPLIEPGADRLLARIKELKWFVQIHCEKDELAEAAPMLLKAGVRIMVDHFGRPDIGRGVSQLGFQALLEFGRTGNAVIKLSGPFRSSREGYPYRDVDPFIAQAIEAFTLANCVWGSDWPFVRLNERMDYGPVRSCLDRWLPDPKDRRKVLWENPKRLFGFKE
jgi:predicted TIM-barrel fold metal-dependent hydrolase